jgi:hypothetical protein
MSSTTSKLAAGRPHHGRNNHRPPAPGQEDKALVQYEKAAALAASEQKAVNSEQ